jgi:tetratricopeptide (TPR) repeat protein
MALVAKGGDPLTVAKKVVTIVQDLGEDDPEEDLEDFQAKKDDANKSFASGQPGQALEAAIVALEAMLEVSIKFHYAGKYDQDGTLVSKTAIMSGSKSHLIKPRIREITFLIKDAIKIFKAVGDTAGQAASLMALSRAHLARGGEPDAPAAALRASAEALTLLGPLGNSLKEAEAMRLAGACQITKAGMSPFDTVMVAASDKAIEALKDAITLFKKAGNKKGQALAMYETANALLAKGDEDSIMEAEKVSEDAMDLFRFTGKKAAEVKAVMTLISCRMSTSGPDSALMLSKDTAAEYKTEKRVAHEAQATHAAAELLMAKEEYEDAMTMCKQAEALFKQAGRKRGAAGALNTMAGIHAAKGTTQAAVEVLSEVVNIFASLGDKRAEGGANFAIADLLLGKLTDEVETETLKQGEKDTGPLPFASHTKLDDKPIENKPKEEKDEKKLKEPEGLTTDDVYRRGEEGLEYAGRSFECYEMVADEPGMEAVQEIIRTNFQRGVDLYAKVCEPDIVTQILGKGKRYSWESLDGFQAGVVIKQTKKEWKVQLNRFKKLAEQEGIEGAGVFTITEG